MLLALLAIVVAAPFERVIVAVPGVLSVTSVEIVMLAAIAAIAIGGDVRPGALGRLPLVRPGVLFLGALLAAALLAPLEQGNALRFVTRMLLAAVLFAATVHVVNTRTRARALVRVIVAVAALVALIAVFEVAQVPAVMSPLTTFRPGFHVVAGQLRATSTLFYPTIASMYLEIAFALGLWLLLDPAGRRPSVERALTFVALVTIGAGISATFTRAGLIAMAVALLVVGGLCLTRATHPRRDLGVLTTLAATLVAVVFVAHSPELLAARLTTDGSAAWYGAQYTVPPSLSLRTGAVHRVPVSVTNTGRLTWDSLADPPFALSYHWLRPESGAVVVFEGQRTPFPRVVPPGGRIAMDADVIAPPQPGRYVLVWDVVHETRAWLSTEGVASPRTVASVTGDAVGAAAIAMAQLPAAPIRPSRPRLWSAAVAMWADHPLTGVGPDNYRLAYGRYLGVERPDPRVHANNMYLEILAGAGIAGLVALLALMAAGGWALWTRLRRAHPSAHVALSAACAALAVVAGHGLVDSFLSFTTTYVMFAVAAGLSFSPGLMQPAVR